MLQNAFQILHAFYVQGTNPNPTARVQNSISDPRPSIPGPSNYSKHSKHKQQQQQHSSTSSGSNAATSNRPSNAALKLFEQWKGVQDGREMASEVFNVDVDTLFTLLFTNSKFYADFNAMRKTFGETMRGEKVGQGELCDRFRRKSFECNRKLFFCSLTCLALWTLFYVSVMCWAVIDGVGKADGESCLTILVA